MVRIKNQPHRKSRYILIYLPAAIAVILFLLYLLERSGIIERKFIGYEGPREVTPRVEIVTPETGKEDLFARRHHPMKLTEPKTEKTGTQESEKKEEKEKETKIPDEIDIEPDKYYRSYPSHTRAPYSEDYVILKMVKPEYPDDALKKGIEGYVIIEVLIGKDGKVKEAWTRKVYGTESFRDVSLEAIEKFVFRPKTQNGEPQTFWISFIFKFNFFGK